MILIVKSDGTVIPTATIVWGTGIQAEHRGNNVWHASGFLAASEFSALTRTVWSTDDFIYTRTHSVTRDVTKTITATRTRSPVVQKTVTRTHTRTHWHPVTEHIGTRTRTETIYVGDHEKTRSVYITCTSYVTHTVTEGTRSGTNDLTRTGTKTRTATRTGTQILTQNVVTVTKTIWVTPDCCDDCYCAAADFGATLDLGCDICPPGGTPGCGSGLYCHYQKVGTCGPEGAAGCHGDKVGGVCPSLIGPYYRYELTEDACPDGP